MEVKPLSCPSRTSASRWLFACAGVVTGCWHSGSAQEVAREFAVGFSAIGEWGAGIAGADPEVPTRFTARPDTFCVYRPRIEAAARAIVAIYRVSETGSASQQRYEVHHAGGVAAVDVPFTGTSGWVTLGAYEFSGRATEHVRLVKAFSTPIRAAEVRFTWLARDGVTPVRTDVIAPVPVTGSGDVSRAAIVATTPAPEQRADEISRTAAGLELPLHLSDGIVFQRGAPIVLSGRAPENAKVTATLDGRSAAGVTREGVFNLELPAMTAGGPHELRIVCGGEERIVRDVLIGEVWICAGQSNMAMAVSGMSDREAVLADAEYPQIRYYKQSGGERPDGRTPPRWVSATRREAASFTAVGFSFARKLHRELGVPVGLVYAWRSGGDIRLFMRDEALARLAPRIPFTAAGATPRPTLFSDFLAPLVGMPIAGLLFYQGEGNQKEPLFYRELLPAMVRDIRSLWGRGDFAFINVQLPRYRDGFVGVREAQFLAQRAIPNSALVVTIDAGVPDLLHPGDKRIIGERAAQAALGLVHQRPGAFGGPLFHEANVSDGAMIARFDQAGQGLEARGELDGFVLRGAMGGFMPAKAQIVGPNLVRIWRDGVSQPTAVRYLWSGSPRASLFNREGFPASPFRTDSAGDVVIFDNADPDVSTRGTWQRSDRKDAFGTDVLVAADERGTLGVSDWQPWIKWRFEVARTGTYAVDLWCPAGGAEPARAIVEVAAAGRTHPSVEVAQNNSGGQWYRIGEYALHYGNSDHLKLRALSAGVAADAVRLTFLRE